MYPTNFKALRIGKEYKVEVIDIDLYGEFEFKVLDEQGHMHIFSFYKYDEYFYTEKEMRKLKLERLEGLC